MEGQIFEQDSITRFQCNQIQEAQRFSFHSKDYEMAPPFFAPEAQYFNSFPSPDIYHCMWKALVTWDEGRASIPVSSSPGEPFTGFYKKVGPTCSDVNSIEILYLRHKTYFWNPDDEFPPLGG